MKLCHGLLSHRAVVARDLGGAHIAVLGQQPLQGGHVVPPGAAGKDVGGGLLIVEQGQGAHAQISVGHQAVVLLKALHRRGSELAIDPVGIGHQIPQLQQPLLPGEDLVRFIPDPQAVGHGLVPEEGLHHGGIHPVPGAQPVQRPKPGHGLGGGGIELAVGGARQVAQLNEPLLDAQYLVPLVPREHGVEGGVLVVQLYKGFFVAVARFRQAVAPLEQGHGGGHAGAVHVLGLLKIQVFQGHEPDLDVQHDGGAHARADGVPVHGMQRGRGGGHLRGHRRGGGGGQGRGRGGQGRGGSRFILGLGAGGHLDHVFVSIRVRQLHRHGGEGLMEHLPGVEPAGHDQAQHQNDQEPDQQNGGLVPSLFLLRLLFHAVSPLFSYGLL